MPKECVVPETIQVVEAITGQPGAIIPFRTAAYQLWLSDARWQNPLVRRARLTIILPEFDKRPGQKMRFADEDHAVLVDIIKNPAKNAAGLFMLYDVLIQRQLEPYEACILEARSFSLDEVPSAPKKKARR